MNQLPKLIEDKIQDYIDNNNWKEKIRTLHQEYVTKIIIVKPWFDEAECLCYEEDINASRTITYVDTKDTIAINNQIRNFINGRLIKLKSINHYYSSGLNNPFAYKDAVIMHHVYYK